jgi:hypothetical protein
MDNVHKHNYVFVLMYHRNKLSDITYTLTALPQDYLHFTYLL